MTRTDMPPSWDERTMLTHFLDYARATAVAKCADLAPEHGARRRCPVRRS